MNVLDSSAWIEVFVGGPRSAEFRPFLTNPAGLLVPSVCVTEVHRWMLRTAGPKEALRATAGMLQGRVIDLDAELAVAAAELGRRHGLPLADSIIYATARAHDAVVWTLDADFKGLEGVEYRARG